MKKKYKDIIRLVEDKQYMEHTNESQIFIGWGCLFGSLLFWIGWALFTNSSGSLYTSYGLFVFGILCLYLGYYGKKEINEVNKRLKKLTSK